MNNAMFVCNSLKNHDQMTYCKGTHKCTQDSNILHLIVSLYRSKPLEYN